MHITIRVDASIEMGTGHVMRCLTLAEELKRRGANILFITRALNGHMAETIADHGFSVELLPEVSDEYRPKDHDVPHATWLKVSQEQDAAETIQALSNRKTDWLIVDHYALDARWHQKLRKHTQKIFVIDDLEDRFLDCDALLDQTFGRDGSKYRNLIINNNTIFFLGAKYALLRPEFHRLRKNAISKRKNYTTIRSILITMGGADLGNSTAKILQGLASIHWPYPPTVDIVLGKLSTSIDMIYEQAEHLPYNTSISVGVSDMGDRMLSADLAISAGGSTLWELCCLGLPSLVIIAAKNQCHAVARLESKEAIVNLGWGVDILPEQISRTVTKLIDDKHRWSLLSNNAFKITTGKGASTISSFIIGGQ